MECEQLGEIWEAWGAVRCPGARREVNGQSPALLTKPSSCRQLQPKAHSIVSAEEGDEIPEGHRRTGREDSVECSALRLDCTATQDKVRVQGACQTLEWTTATTVVREHAASSVR